VTETDIRLSADTDCNEERAVAAGQRILRMLAFLLWEDSEGKGDIFSECFLHEWDGRGMWRVCGRGKWCTGF